MKTVLILNFIRIATITQILRVFVFGTQTGEASWIDSYKKDLKKEHKDKGVLKMLMPTITRFP